MLLNNVFSNFGFIGKLTGFESGLFIVLCLLAAIFLGLSVVVFLFRKRQKTILHTILLVVCLSFMLLLIGIGFSLVYLLKDSKASLIVDLVKAYKSHLIIIPYLVVLAAMLLCFSVLLFLPELSKKSIKATQNDVEPSINPAFDNKAPVNESANASQEFAANIGYTQALAENATVDAEPRVEDTAIDVQTASQIACDNTQESVNDIKLDNQDLVDELDEPLEIDSSVVNDVFKEFGNCEADVQNGVERIAGKLIKESNDTKSKEIVAQIDDALQQDNDSEE